jgi:predicted O-methyltransferase YrrM
VTDPRPHSVSGWLHEAEAVKLQELAKGKLVLELGSQYGLSTIVMAKVADKVVSVDWHKGDEHAGFHNTLQPFTKNLKKFSVADKVIVLVGRFEDVCPHLQQHSFDLVFVDGQHDKDSVCRDAGLAMGLVKKDGVVAFHDYGIFEVKEGVGLALLAEPDEIVDTLAVYRLK